MYRQLGLTGAISNQIHCISARSLSNYDSIDEVFNQVTFEPYSPGGDAVISRD